MSYPPLRGQNASDLEALDRLNILAEYAANHGMGRIERVEISVGDLLDLREILSGRVGEGFPTKANDSPGLKALRYLEMVLASHVASLRSQQEREKFEGWRTMAGQAIGYELHWRSDVRDVLRAAMNYAVEEEKVKPRHLAHERKLLGAVFRLMDRP